jgi:HAD domain in Swiss Army Knife RNA repair proteins
MAQNVPSHMLNNGIALSNLSSMGLTRTLFLDIDGVLHPATVGELEYDEFGPKVTGGRVCALEADLAHLVAGRDVEIVIHSTWIYMFDLTKLQADWHDIALPRLNSRVAIVLRGMSVSFADSL